MSAHSPKRGDWQIVGTTVWYNRPDADAAMHVQQRLHPERRLRTKYLAMLGWVVQVFVPRITHPTDAADPTEEWVAEAHAHADDPEEAPR